MFPMAISLSRCIVLAVWTRGSLGLIGFLPPLRPRARGRQPCLGPLLDQPPLELGEGGEDVEHQLARRGRGVDRPVAEGSEAHATIPELLDQVDQVNSCHRERGSDETVEAFETTDHYFDRLSDCASF